MIERIHYTLCPACHSDHIHKHLSVRDHSVSLEFYEIWHCTDCSLRFTQDIPDENGIGEYYQSENYISHTDTNKGVVNRLYRIIRQFTLKGKKGLIRSHTRLAQGTLLDLGAGTGAFVSYMKRSGWEVTGLEPDAQARRKAGDLYSIELQDSPKLFEWDEPSFDGITLWHVIEHVHTLHPYLNQLKKILKPSGTIFIAVPNYTSYDARIYKEFWAAYDTPRHLYHFSPAAMKSLVLQHGLRLKQIVPMWFDSIYVSLLSEKNKSGHTNLLKGFWNGGISNIKAAFHKEKTSSLIYVITK